MEIYPEDLGPRANRQVLEHRQWRDGTQGVGPTASPMGRVPALPTGSPFPFWAYALALFAVWVAVAALHFSFIGIFFFGVPLTLLWRRMRGGPALALSSAQRGFAETHTSTYVQLIEAEIAFLQNGLLKEGTADPLLGMYLELVLAAINLAPLGADRAGTERNAREAIRALGGAIETLPPQSLDGIPDSGAKLQATAARLAAEAPGETDPVVAASLHRRIEALQGQAETVARVRVLLRRNDALREEMADQIGALRTSLAAAALGGDDSGPELAGLAARIRRVVAEANAVTDAHAEVDALLSQSRTGRPVRAEEPQRQVLGLNGEAL